MMRFAALILLSGTMWGQNVPTQIQFRVPAGAAGSAAVSAALTLVLSSNGQDSVPVTLAVRTPR